MTQRPTVFITFQTNGAWGTPAQTVVLTPIQRRHMEELGMSALIGTRPGCSWFILGCSVTNSDGEFGDIYFTFEFTGQSLDLLYPAAANCI
jgi:hypothetical protein